MPTRRTALAAVMASFAAKQAWAEEALHLVVAYPPGGISDSVTRLLATRLAPILGGSVRVSNQPGAGGAIALRALSRAAADGRTLVYSSITPIAFEPGLARLVTPLASVMSTPSLVVGTPAFEGSDFDAFLALARARPGSLRWATSGIATTGHLVLEEVCRRFGIDVTHVPYKGGGQQLADALSGQFELLTTNFGPLQMGYLRRGRLLPLAVGAASRQEALAGVPTLLELGCPRGNLASLFGLFAVAGTVRSTLDFLNEAVNMALSAPEIQAAIRESGNLPKGRGVADFARDAERGREAIARLLGRE